MYMYFLWIYYTHVPCIRVYYAYLCRLYIVHACTSIPLIMWWYLLLCYVMLNIEYEWRINKVFVFALVHDNNFRVVESIQLCLLCIRDLPWPRVNPLFTLDYTYSLSS